MGSAEKSKSRSCILCKELPTRMFRVKKVKWHPLTEIGYTLMDWVNLYISIRLTITVRLRYKVSCFATGVMEEVQLSKIHVHGRVSHCKITLQMPHGLQAGRKSIENDEWTHWSLRFGVRTSTDSFDSVDSAPDP